MDSLLTSITEDSIKYTTATFKSTRIINGHSVERMKKGQLDFRIHHRFGQINSGVRELFGLDQASTFFSLEYGINNRLMIGAGRSTYQKTYDGFLKYALLRQCKGKKNIPITITLLSEIDAYSTKWEVPDRKNYFSSRLSYAHQILVAKKFNEHFSFQLSPTLIHKNLVKEITDKNDLFSVGLGGRFKLTKRISLNSEYFYTVRPTISGKDKLPNSFSIGIDIETGGHVFQFLITNSLPMFERGFITETTGKWTKGGISLGFNISRVFNLNRTK
jgi:hypothetical protein